MIMDERWVFVINNALKCFSFLIMILSVFSSHSLSENEQEKNEIKMLLLQYAIKNVLEHRKFFGEDCAPMKKLQTIHKNAVLRPFDILKDCPSCPEMVVVPSGEYQMGAEYDVRIENHFF